MSKQIRRELQGLAAAAVVLGAAMLPTIGNATSDVGNEGIDGVQISFGGWGGEEGATKDYFDGFRSSFTEATGAEVEWVGAPYDQTQQQLALRATSDPVDVAQVDIGWITSFAGQDQLVDLNDVYGADTLESLFPANYLELGQRDGKQVALPWTIASISLVANMDVLEAAGITEVPTTTQEFRDALQAVKDTQPDVIPYALNTKTAALVSPFLQPWIWTFGGNIYTDGQVSVDDGPGTADALEYLSGLVDDGLIQKDVDIFTARTLFAEGQVAFYDDAIIARSLVTDADRAQAVMPLARPVLISGDDPQSIQWGHALVMFAKDRTDQELDAAQQFMMWLENPDVVGDYFTEQGLLPSTIAGLDAQDPDAYSRAWATITATSRPDETAAFANGAEIAEIVGQHGEAAYNGIEAPDQAATAMADELTQLR